MVSLNDGEDPHFRKAEFDSTQCPPDCNRPCEKICPAQAINFSGVIAQRCYGCGRCIPICPYQLIIPRSYVSTPSAIAPLVQDWGIDALEIHTQVGHQKDFQRLWKEIQPWSHHLKVLAISCPDHPNLIEYLYCLYKIISPLPYSLIWQTDGRPMSGDIGKGTTHAAIKLAMKVLSAGLPGYVQLAGGTNHHTVSKLESMGILGKIAGIAYGSYARSLLSPILEQLETEINKATSLEKNPQLLWDAVSQAHSLVKQLKLRKTDNLFLV
jgi:Fe-S-cluster-containing hydrogenase component 2